MTRPATALAIRLAASLAAIAILSGCGNQMGQGSSGGSMGGMDMGGTSRSARATLVPANAVTGTGTANLAVVKDQVHVDVRAQQLAAGSSYTVHLHKGSCAAIGDVVRTIGSLPTDATGSGTVHLEYKGSDFPVPSFVDVHEASGSEGPAICGDLQ